MRFTMKDLKTLLEAAAVLAEEDPHRHSESWAREKLADLAPRLAEAYCVAVGIELPID